VKNNRNKSCWQIEVFLLLRFSAFANKWQHGFKRFFCLLRSSVWDGVSISSLASFCGIAGGIPAMRAAPEQLYLPGFSPQKGRM